jgi:hypothetical protein
MRLWLIPIVYASRSVIGGFTLPRIEHVYFRSYTLSLSVSSAEAYLSSVASGTLLGW